MDDELCFLFKFGELENLKKLQKGCLYCKNLKWYADQEKNTGDKAMGDKLEGIYIMTDSNIKLINPESGQIVYQYNNSNVLISYGDLEKTPVFCMTGIDKKDFSFVKTEDGTLVACIKLDDIIGEVYNEPYWNSALIIDDITKFLERVTKACKDKGIDLTKKFVNYTDMRVNYKDRVLDIDSNYINIAFWKDNLYSYQHEYRFVFEGQKVDNSFTINIGDISDISTIYNSDQLKEFMKREYRL